MRLIHWSLLLGVAFALACGDSDPKPAPTTPPPSPAPPPEPPAAPPPAVPEPAPSPTAAPAPEPASGGEPGAASAGAETYRLFCETCHGATGVGDGPGAVGIDPPPRDFSQGEFVFDANGNGTKGEDEDLAMVIAQGAGAFGGNMLMTPWAGALTNEQIADVVAYIRTLKK